MSEHRIETFKELMDEICYSWDGNFPDPIVRHSDGSFSVHKLDIFPDHINYKGNITKISKQAFMGVKAFYALVETM